MADSEVTTAQIAGIIAQHSICECGEWADNFDEHCAHIASVLLASFELVPKGQLHQEWAVAPAFCPEAPYMETCRRHPNPPQPQFLNRIPPETCEVARLVGPWRPTDSKDEL